jgi:hypothetical protein
VTAAAKSESKMDAFAKEKVALETKNKVCCEGQDSEDVMKRITDGMDEAKNFEGLKSKKTNYSQRLKLDLA